MIDIDAYLVAMHRYSEEWADVHIGDTYHGKYRISTVALPPDIDGSPGKFETMIFPDAVVYDRYATEYEAQAGHWRAVYLVVACVTEERPVLLPGFTLDDLAIVAELIVNATMLG